MVRCVVASVCCLGYELGDDEMNGLLHYENISRAVLMLSILRETVAYYKEDVSRRAYVPDVDSGGVCKYHTEDGRVCAVGRYLSNPEEQAKDACGVSSLAVRYDGLDSILKEEVRGLSMDFWIKLQGLHDTNFHWNDEGMTPAGERAAMRLELLVVRGAFDSKVKS